MANEKKKYKVVVSTTTDVTYIVDAWSPGHAKELVSALPEIPLPQAYAPESAELPGQIGAEHTSKRIFRPTLAISGKDFPGPSEKPPAPEEKGQ